MSPARLLIVVGALGCGAVLPKSAKSEFFVLTALEQAPPTSPGAAPPSVLLGRVALPQYLDRPEIVTRLASNQLRVEELEQWAEPLRDSLPRTLERNLAALLGSGRVQHLPWTGPSPPDMVVALEVQRFEKTSAEKVELVARWTIGDGKGQAIRLSRDTRLVYFTAGKSTGAAVASMSQALAALSQEIATSVQRLTPAAVSTK